MKRIHVLSLITCALAFPVIANAQINNGSFAGGDPVTGNVPGWDRAPMTDPVNVPTSGGAYSQFDPRGCFAMGVDLGSGGSNADLSQIFTSVLGAGVIDFSMLVDTNDLTGGDVLHVSIDGTDIGTIDSAAMVAGSSSFNYVGTGGNQTIMFRLSPDGDFANADSDTQICLTGVSSRGTNVPEPGTWAAMLMGGLGLLGFARRRK